MALNTNVSKTPAKAMVNALVDSLDTGTAATHGTIELCSGVQPASPDTGTPTVLATFDLPATAFGAATTGTGTETGYIIAQDNFATLTATASTAITGTKTASFFRAKNKDGVAKIDGSAGTATADLIINSVSVVAGQQIKVTAWKVRFPFK